MHACVCACAQKQKQSVASSCGLKLARGCVHMPCVSNWAHAHHGPQDDAASVMTADEDAFDVTEAFDEGVDYGILDDDADDPTTDNEDVSGCGWDEFENACD